MEQIRVENYCRVAEFQRSFQQLAEQRALVGVQLELGSAWLIVDTEGEIAASFKWHHRSRKERVTTEEHKSYFALQCILQNVRTDLIPSARFGMIFWQDDGIRCVSLGRGRSTVHLHGVTQIAGPRDSSLLRVIFRGASPQYCTSNCVEQTRTGTGYWQPQQTSSDEEGSC